MSPIPRHIARAVVVAGSLLFVVACQPAQEEEARPAEDTSPGVPSWEQAPIVLPQGTVLRCAVAEDVSVRTARVGDVVTLIATEKVVLDGVDVVLPGTHLQARVSRVKRGRSLRAPELTLDTVSIESPQGILRDCPARSIQVALESDDHGLAAGTLVDVFVSAPIAMPLPEGI